MTLETNKRCTRSLRVTGVPSNSVIYCWDTWNQDFQGKTEMDMFAGCPDSHIFSKLHILKLSDGNYNKPEFERYSTQRLNPCLN